MRSKLLCKRNQYLVIEKMLTLTRQCTLETGPRVWLDRIMDPILHLSRRQKERCSDTGRSVGDSLVQRLGSSGTELKMSHVFENFMQTKIMLAWTEVDRNRMK